MQRRTTWRGLFWMLAWPCADALAGPQRAPAQSQATTATPPDAQVQTLDRVQALKPDEEVLDLYRFRNPIQVQPNHFSKAWSPPPSPEEISKNGGYLFYGLGKLVQAVGKGFKGIPGVKDQIHSATARPPPLSLEQMDRALRACGQEGQACVDAAAPAPAP